MLHLSTAARSGGPVDSIASPAPVVECWQPTGSVTRRMVVLSSATASEDVACAYSPFDSCTHATCHEEVRHRPPPSPSGASALTSASTWRAAQACAAAAAAPRSGASLPPHSATACARVGSRAPRETDGREARLPFATWGRSTPGARSCRPRRARGCTTPQAAARSRTCASAPLTPPSLHSRAAL